MWFPPWALTSAQGNHFRRSCQTWQYFRKLADGLIRVTERVDRLSGTRLPGVLHLCSPTPLRRFPSFLTGQTESIVLCVQQHFAVKERFLSPRQKLLWGFQIDTRITEWWSRKRRGLRNDLTPFADFADEQRDGKGSVYGHTASWW